MTPTELLLELTRWRDAGWLRSLDLALAGFVHDCDPAAPASLLLAAALVAQLEGRGHSGLPLAELATQPNATLAWPPEAAAALAVALADWPADGASRRQAWQACPALERDPADDSGASPLVLSQGLLYLRRYWRYETRVAAQILARASVPAAGQAAPPDVDLQTVRALLDGLFGPATIGVDAQSDIDADIDWQKVACALALRGRLTIITGGPGTGKTFTAARLLVLLQALHPGPQPLRVALAAPTGKAAARLRQSIHKALQGLREQLGAAFPEGPWTDQIDAARTLHALLGTQPGTRRFRHDAADPLDVDVLFVDEASMVHLEMMAQLFEALPAQARVVLLGDKDQLASVEAGAVMGDLCLGAAEGGAAGGYWSETVQWIRDTTGQDVPLAAQGPGPGLAQQTVVLRKSHRFDGPIGQLALAVNRGDAAAALTLLRSRADGPVAWAPTPEASVLLPLAVRGRPEAAGAPGAQVGYAAYLEQLQQRPAAPEAFDDWARSVLRQFDRFRVLCAVREGPWGVAGLNAAIERRLAEDGLLARRGEWYEGRPVIITRNDPSLGVFNGDVGVVLRSPSAQGGLRCYLLDGDALRSVSVGRLADVETAFAMTVHKSQGSEFEHVLLVLPEDDVPVLTRELVYTGITRASQAFTLVSRRAATLALAIGRLTRRVSGLRNRLV